MILFFKFNKFILFLYRKILLKFLCASAGKNQPLIYNYVIKFLLVLLMKHLKG